MTSAAGSRTTQDKSRRWSAGDQRMTGTPPSSLAGAGAHPGEPERRMLVADRDIAAAEAAEDRAAGAEVAAPSAKISPRTVNGGAGIRAASRRASAGGPTSTR